MTLLLRTAASALALVAGLGLASGDAARAAEMVYRSATMGEPKSLDPHSVSGAWENIVVGDLFMGLATDAADASPIPGAAESWQISDDGLTYTFKIRDHTWSDGTPVTAEDFVYSFRRVLDPKKAAEYASILYPIKNAEAINSGKLASLEELGARAIDAKTLEVKLENPTGYFIELLTHYTAFGLPKHAIEKHGDEWIKPANLVVNGPFKITEWSPNTRLVAEKNQKFYDAANVKIDKSSITRTRTVIRCSSGSGPARSTSLTTSPRSRSSSSSASCRTRRGSARSSASTTTSSTRPRSRSTTSGSAARSPTRSSARPSPTRS
jgi:oligopeptide transport system substrate-binding protein